MPERRVILSEDFDWSVKRAFDPERNMIYAIQGIPEPGTMLEQELIDGEWITVRPLPHD